MMTAEQLGQATGHFFNIVATNATIYALELT